MLDLLRKCFPEEVKSATRFDFITAESLGRPGCPKCNGHGYLVVHAPNGGAQYNYCDKSMCAEYKLRKANKNI